MVDKRVPKDMEVKEPQPDEKAVEVDCGTSSAIHELDLEGEVEQVPKGAVAAKLPPKKGF